MLMTVTDERGIQTVAYIYGAKGQIVSQTNPSGMTSYSYDIAGNLLQVTDAMMMTSTINYDALNRPLSFTNSLGHTTSLTYNANGQTTQVTYPDNTTRLFSYNNMGWLTQVTDALQGTSQFQYNANGQVTQAIDAMNCSTTYNYGTANQLLTVSDGGGTYSYAYTPIGSPATYTDANGITSAFTYNDNDELTHIAYSNGAFENYVLNANGEVTNESNNNGNISYLRDMLGMITGITDMFGNQTKYEYDQIGNPLKIVYPNNDSTEYWYDLNGQITDVFFNQNFMAKYYYNAMGQLSKDSLRNGRYSLYQYDAIGRLIEKGQYNNTGSLFARNQYTLNNMGNITTDNALLPMQPNVSNQIVTNAYSYSNDNCQVSATGNTFSRDNNGNRTATAGTNTESYTFAQNNLLTSFTKKGNTQQFLYDNGGNKVRDTKNGQVTRFVNDNFLGLSTPLEERNASNQLQVSYILGPGGVPIARDSAGTYLFYHFDAKGNTLALSDSNANITDTYAYDPFGDYSLHTGSTQQPFEYLGGYGIQHQVENLFYVRARFYDAQQGRFLSKDPIAGAAGNTQGRNQYVYGFDNPLMWNDASGMYPEKMCKLSPHPTKHQKKKAHTSKKKANNSCKKEKSTLEKLTRYVPIYGSVMDARESFEDGRWGWGIFHTVLAITDVVPVKTLITVGVKAVGKKILFKEVVEEGAKAGAKVGLKDKAKEAAIV